METTSILIPCYNDQEYVGQSIESALNQTWEDCEVIVVDDGSVDGSRSVARRYESEEVHVLTQENQGPAAARNRALEASTGDYIQYLDADDILHPRKIESQIDALQERPAGTVAVCSTVYFQEGTPPEAGRRAKGGTQIPWLTSEDPVQWLIDLWTPDKGWGMVQPGAWLTPRSVAEEAGPWDERLSLDDDGEYFARVVLASAGVQYVSTGGVYYRQHEGERISGQKSKDAFKSWLRSVDLKRQHLMPRVPAGSRREAARGIARQYWSIALSAYPAFPEIAALAEARAANLGFPEILRSVSQNGWKGRAASFLKTTLGWRAARWGQWAYHWIRDAPGFS